MKGYLQTNSRVILRGRIYKTVIIIIIILIFYGVLGAVLKNLSSPFVAIFSPMWRAQSYIQEVYTALVGFTKDKNELIESNRQLRVKLQALNAIEASQKVLREENKELKEMLGRDDVGMQKTVLATILMRPNQSVYDTLILDAGKNIGVKIGDRIIVEDTIVLGEIIEVFANQSRAQLFSSPDRQMEISIGSENITSIAIGVGGSNFQAKLPREVDVQIGDSIIIPSIDVYVLGVVGEIIYNPSDSFQTILFKIPVNIQELRWVQIAI